MTTSQHKARHILLHKHLDELVADWITHSGSTPSKATVLQLLHWSHAQAIEPSQTFSLHDSSHPSPPAAKP
jgi:hypothetical protein